MPASDLLSDAYFGPPATSVPTDFGSVYDDTFDDTLRTRQPTAYLLSVAEEGRAFSERNDLIKQRFSRDIVQEVRQEFPEAGADFLISEYQKRTDQLIDEGRTKDIESWRGIRKAAEIEAATIDQAQVAKIESERTTARAEDNFARYGGSLAGGIAASFLDPINVATLPLGAGAGMGILRGALLDGALNMGVEAAEAPFNAQWQREIGFKYGLGDAAADIATAGVGGAALSAFIRGSAKGLQHLSGRSEKILRDIASSPDNGSEVRDAAKYMQRVAHVDENMPPPQRLDEILNPYEVVAAHRANMQETQDAFRAFRPPIYSDDIPFDVPVAAPPQPLAARAFEEGAASSGKFESYTRPTPPEMRTMQGLVSDLAQAEKASIIMVEKDGQGSTADIKAGSQNTFPQWFRDMNREGESLSRDYVAKVLAKVEEGAALGKKEVRVAKALFEEARALREENARQILNFRHERADALRAENEASIDALAAREAQREKAVAHLTGKEIHAELTRDNSLQAARDYYLQHLQDTTVTRPGLGEIKFTGKGWRKLKAGLKVDADRVRLIPAVREIIMKGEYQGRDPLNKVRDDGITAFHHFIAPVEVNGRIFEAGVSVAEDSHGKLFYNLNRDPRALLAKRKAPGEPRSLAQGQEPLDPRASAPDQISSVSPSDESVNIEIKQLDTLSRGGSDMPDPYLEPMPHAAATLAEDVKAGAESEMMDAAHADFQRLLAEEPDFTLVMEDGSTRTMKELAEELADDKAILEAVTICGVG